MSSATTQPIKSEIVAIVYGGVVKQICKMAKDYEEANNKLFSIGEEIGQRVADEYTDLTTSSSQPDQTVPAFLRGIMAEYMGCDSAISPPAITYGKGKFSLKFTIILKDNPVSDFIVLRKKEEEGTQLNYHSIVMGFVSGCLKTMTFHPTVTLAADALTENNPDMATSIVMPGRTETIFEVDMWKEKEED